jgi:hypothetical protein
VNPRAQEVVVTPDLPSALTALREDRIGVQVQQARGRSGEALDRCRYGLRGVEEVVTLLVR